MMKRLAIAVVAIAFLSSCGGNVGDGKSTLWAETLQLCADTVYRVGPIYEPGSDEPLLSVELREPAARHLSRMTARLIGEPMEITLDDKVLAAPVVAERVRGGIFQIAGLPPGDFERAWEEMEEPCAPGDARKA